MAIPTEPIGSIPQPLRLIETIVEKGATHSSLEPLHEEAIHRARVTGAALAAKILGIQ